MEDANTGSDRASRDRLVIRPEEVPPGPSPPPGPPSTPPSNAAWPTQPGSRQLPGLGTTPPVVRVTGTSDSGTLLKLGSNTVMTGLFGGAIGGFLGAVLAEVLYSPDDRFASSISEARTQSGIFVAIVGALIGFVLLAWDGFTSGATEKGLRDGLIGGAAGVVAGFVGGYLAQIIFAEMLEDVSFDEDVETQFILARVIAWAIFGALLGVGLGLRGGSRKIVNGLIGGALGGAVGGLLFQLIENGNDDGGSATMNRFVGLTLTGVGIGLGVGLVERARREAWVTIAAGPMAGKEFILYNARTVIGSDHQSHIVLARDPSVAPQHMTFERTDQGTTVVAVRGQVMVNGAPISTHRLRAGDQISVGQSVLSYQERAVSGTSG